MDNFGNELQFRRILPLAAVAKAKPAWLWLVARGNKKKPLPLADDGWGVPAGDVPRVFERAFTGENGRRAGSSTGMGLYLVAELCAKMGLAVALASEEGKGTRVLLAFPHDRRKLDLLS